MPQYWVVSFTGVVHLAVLGEFALATGLVEFVLPVLLGNTMGGVALVTVVNYFQTTKDRLSSAQFNGAERQLSVREWPFGGLVGRSYVPVTEDESEWRVKQTRDTVEGPFGTGRPSSP